MSLTLEDVHRIAHLARLGMDDARAEQMRPQLNDVFALIAQMQAVDTTHVEPMAHAQDVSLRLREDVVTYQNQREAFQTIAPQVEAGLYLVPKVIE